MVTIVNHILRRNVTEVEAGEPTDILELEGVSEIIVPYDTPFAEVQAMLPTTITANLRDSSTVPLAVTWAEGLYDGLDPDTYTISGTITLSGGATNPDALQPSVDVTVQASALAGARLFYDADKQSYADEDTITTFVDSAGAFNGTGGNTPKFDIESSGGNNVKSYRDESNNYISTGTSGDGAGSGLVDRNFLWFGFFSTTDGRMASGVQHFGGRGSDTNRLFQIFVNNAGDLSISWGYTGVRWTYTVSAMLADGALPVVSVAIHVNFTDDTVSVYKNGILQTGSFTLSNISAANPSLYDNLGTLVWGNISANGSFTTNTTATQQYKTAITGLKSVTAAREVHKEFIASMYRTWSGRFNVTPLNYATKRQGVIDFLWNGTSGPPTANTVDLLTTSFSGTMHGTATADVTGVSEFTRLRFNITDGQGFNHAFFIYHMKNSSPNGQLILLNRGHDSEAPASSLATINKFTALGYDILFCAMPVSDPMVNGDNTTSNPNLSAGHEDMYADGVIDDDYSAGHLFFDSQIRAMNYIIANSATYGAYSKIIATGISGGGWTTLLLTAVDTRIYEVHPVRGNNDQSAKWSPFNLATHHDQEQAPVNGDTTNGPQWLAFHDDNSLFDIIALAVHGGRKVNLVSHIEDSATHGAWTFFAWEQAMKHKAKEMGGEYKMYMSFTAGQGTHDWREPERNAIVAELIKANNDLFEITDIPDAPTILVDTGELGAWDGRALICGPVYHNGTILLYGGSAENNAGDVNEYEIGAFDLTNAYSGSKDAANPIITRTSLSLGALEGIVPHDIWSDGTYYYMACTVYNSDQSLDVALMRAPIASPKAFTDFTRILTAGHGNHAARFFEDPDNPTYLYMTYAHKTLSSDPFKINVARCLKSNLLTGWTVVDTDIIASTPSDVSQEYAQIWKEGSTWYCTYGRFEGYLGSSPFTMWSTSSNDRTSFAEGQENLLPSLVAGQFDENYRSHFQVETYPIPSTDVPFYFGGRQGTGSANYIGIGVKNIRKK